VFGAGGGTSAYQEAEETDLIILWGSNARETHPIFFHHVLKGKRRGARVYAIDPRRTSSSAFADVWLGLEVGSDVALSNTIAREIIAAGLCNTAFIERATTGFEEYKASVEPYTLARGEELTGVKAEVIRELAHAYARADRAQACWTLGNHGTSQRRRQCVRHHQSVAADRPCRRWGSGLVPLRGQNNVQGGGDMGAIPNKFPGGQDVENPENHASSSAPTARKFRPNAGMHLSQMFEAMEHGTMKALYCPR
jgi:formate dehydrogenase major subunit